MKKTEPPYWGSVAMSGETALFYFMENGTYSFSNSSI